MFYIGVFDFKTRGAMCVAYAICFAYHVSYLGVTETLNMISMDFSKTKSSENDEQVMRFAYSKCLCVAKHLTCVHKM